VVVLVVLFGVLQALFLAGLVVAMSVSDDAVVGSLLESVHEGSYGRTGMPDMMGGTASSFTECVMFGTGLGRPDDGVWTRAMEMPRIGSCGDAPAQLQMLADGVSPDGVTEYFRYWSGYTLVTRPILAVWGVGSLRMLVGALLFAGFGWLWWELARRLGHWYCVALLGPLLVSTGFVALPLSASTALALGVGFAGAALVVRVVERGMFETLAATLVAAAVFCYVDILSVPALPWMLTTAAGGAVVARSRSARATATTMLGIGVMWPLAFTATWAARWVIAVVVLGWDHADRVIRDKVSERLGGGAVDTTYGHATATVWRHWWEHFPSSRVVVLLVLIGVLASLIAWLARSSTRRLAMFGVLAIPALVAPLWFELLRNHSVVHAGKVYLDLPVAFGVLAAAAVAAGSSRWANPELQHAQEEAVQDQTRPDDDPERARGNDTDLLDWLHVTEPGATPTREREN
jgi:hypothetical protein